MSEKSLKEANSPLLVGYALAHVLFLGWVLLGYPISASAIVSAGRVEWSKAGASLVVGLLVTLVNRLGGPELKAQLVFWRYRHPYPGSRAFSELAGRDPRVDLDRLRDAVGGDLPKDPQKQNREWYRLYQQHADNPSVRSGHKEFLLFRDMAWLSVLLAVVGTVAVWIVARSQASWWYGVACIALYLGARTGAAIAGRRFVCSVLACASSSAQLPSSVIMKP